MSDLKLPALTVAGDKISFDGFDSYEKTMKEWQEKASKFVVTPETMAGAKNERAEINRYIKASKDWRSETRERLLGEFNDLNSKMLEIENATNDANNLISDKIKEFEAVEAEKRIAELNKFINNYLSDFNADADFDRPKSWSNKGNYNGLKPKDKFLNAEVMPVLEQKIHEAEQFKADSSVIKDMAEEYEMPYMPYIDLLKQIGAAATIAKIREDSKRAKAQAEAKKAAQEAEMEAERRRKFLDTDEMPNVDQDTGEVFNDNEYQVSFMVTATAFEIDSIKDFLNNNHINYKF